MRGQWSIDNGLTWLNSDQTIPVIKHTDITIIYSHIDNFREPDDNSFRINSDTLINATYIPRGPARLVFTDYLTIMNGKIESGSYYIPPPTFSLPPGYYVNFVFPLLTSITHITPTMMIYYTMDGTPPNIYSTLYTGPVSIPAFDVSDPMGTPLLIRAVAFDPIRGEYSIEGTLEVKKGGSFVTSFSIPEFLAIDTLLFEEDYIDSGTLYNVTVNEPSDNIEAKLIEIDSPKIEGGSFVNVIVNALISYDEMTIENSGKIEGGRFWNPIVEGP